MNKIIVILILLTGLASGAYFYISSQNQSVPNSENNSSITPTPGEDNNSDSIIFEPKEGQSEYKIDWLIVRDPADIKLYSNLDERLQSKEAITKNQCTELVSGGFYTTDFKHIGLFISDGNRLSEPRESLTFSGYFYVSESDRPFISQSPPSTARLAVQSGPLLFYDGEPLNIVTQDDENARRNIAAVTKNNNVVFLTIYEKSSVYSGPRLDELPDILEEINENRNFDFESALNLDGGSASAFYSKFVQLSEISTIGSYFCMQYN